ncbi:MAG TPA: hypothetical protein GXZ51_04120 [Acholeplasma sp.]|jgi:hypothetical protein|nr:hypothetical protein [Acholeplasma sp.]
MMILSSTLVQWLIIGGVVILFIVVTILNRLVKAPEGVKISERCGNCHSKTCILKTEDLEKKKAEIKASLKECEEKGLYEGEEDETK